MELYKEIQYKKGIIKVYYDESPDSPDCWGNDDIFLVYDHRDFTIRRKGFDPQDIWNEMQSETYDKTYNGYYVFPVFAYIHSGISLSLGKTGYPFTDRWDVSMRGFVLVSMKEINYDNHKKMYPELKDNTNEEIARNFAQGLIEEWNDYLSGNIYGFKAEIKGYEDSCWGYYGDPEESGLIEEAKSFIDYHSKTFLELFWLLIKRKFNKLKKK